MGVLTLIGFLEEEFGVEISADDVDLTHFESVAGICQAGRGAVAPNLTSNPRSAPRSRIQTPEGTGALVAGRGGGWAAGGAALCSAPRSWSGTVRWAIGEWVMAPGEPARLLGDRGGQDRDHGLHHNLRAHPELYLPDVKEVHYFDSRWHRPPSWYAGHFVGGAGKKGEITPAYSLLPPERVAAVRRLVPDARLILLVREPVETVWSHAVMKLARERGASRPMSSPRSTASSSAVPHQKQRRLHGHDRAWQAEYLPGRMLVASNDEVRERPVELLARVFTHLGVSVPDDWSRFPAGSVIDRGVGGGADLVGRQRPDSIPTTTADPR